MVSQVAKSKKRLPLGQSQKGQIALEYVLILLVGVAIAFVLSETFASRSVDDPGFLISRWQNLTSAVGADLID